MSERLRHWLSGRGGPPAVGRSIGGPVGDEHRVRITVLFTCVCLGFAVIVYRLVCLQYWWSESYREIALEQHRSKVRIEAQRGSISDRHGRVLATTKRVFAVYAMPGQVEDAAAAAMALAPYLQRSPRALFKQLTSKSGFVYLTRDLPETLGPHVRALGLAGIDLEPATRRYYPNGKLASTLLGFAGVDNEGLEGLEYRYDEFLRGRHGLRLTTRDVYGRQMPALTRIHQHPEPGAAVRLTIDRVVQYHTEQVLRRVFREQGAKSAAAVVLVPRTGAVLAMVSLPDFDPNAYAQAEKGTRRNRAVTDVFEPGSVFKVVPATAALEAGVVGMTTPVYCEDGWYRYYNHVIHDTRPLGTVPFAQVLVQSSNIGIVKVTNLLSPEALHDRITAFGFGRRTGIELAGESPGLYREPRRWSKLSMGALPIGQEIGVTAIQLAAAYGALANDGVRMRPHVVDEIRRADGTLIRRTVPEPIGRACAAGTAQAMRRLLARVVAEGTGKRAAIPGYSVAGKTGTAQKTDPATGRYSKTDYVVLFTGMVPAEHPRFVLVIVVDSPRLEKWGGKVAAPAFAEIARELVQYLEIPPDLPLTPDDANPVVLAKHPAEETTLPPETYLAAGLMPDLRGRTMRDVLALFAPYDVHVRLAGSGLVVKQTPRAGEPLRPNMTCTVVCATASA